MAAWPPSIFPPPGRSMTPLRQILSDRAVAPGVTSGPEWPRKAWFVLVCPGTGLQCETSATPSQQSPARSVWTQSRRALTLTQALTCHVASFITERWRFLRHEFICLLQTLYTPCESWINTRGETSPEVASRTRFPVFMAFTLLFWHESTEERQEDENKIIDSPEFQRTTVKDREQVHLWFLWGLKSHQISFSI